MPGEAAHYDMPDARSQRPRIIDRAGTPVAGILPVVRRADRSAIGSLAGQLDLPGHWDSPPTNAEVAADFGLGE
ncbi:prevent-host-death protein [Dactylosporangium sp. NPDC049140]|jgi:hypothetical protein|uniref:prevent-host-death protein n=1 Tax=Dactylosporangium sp. NPDC049140 TaxID=3155647 RepID=UPI00340B00C1